MKWNHLTPVALSIAGSMGAGCARAAGEAAAQEGYILGIGNVVHLYRVPTKDLAGAMRYFDIEVVLSINDNGKPNGSAIVSAAASPKIQGTKYIAGTYVDKVSGMTCTVGASILQGGRQNGGLICSNASKGLYLSASWATGDIVGHPFELDMRAAGIDKIGGYLNFGWGTVGASTNGIFGCMDSGDMVSVAQAGIVLNVTGYNTINQAACGFSLVLNQ